MRVLYSLLFLVVFSTIAHCERPLKVGLVVQPPFVIKNSLTYNGLAVDLWKEIAQGLKKSYEFVECPPNNLCEPFDNLQNGDIDVLLGPISITTDRYKKVDFTFPFFFDRVIAITAPGYWHNLFLFMKLFFISVGTIIALLIIVFVIYINLLWYYERHYIDNLPKSYKKGIAYIFWHHVFTGRYLELPKSLPGKFLILCHKTVFYFIIISMNATFLSFITVTLANYASPVQNVSDLTKGKIGGVTYSKPYKIGLEFGLNMVPFNSLEEGIQALEKGQVIAVLEDFSLAQAYFKKQNKTNLVTSHFNLKQDLYSFAVQKGNPLLAEINMQLLELQQRDVPEKICREYFQEGAKNCAF
ncbi:MAG: transporter substrate-binding domain-containing protein [Alphaproteobacteria bacterium]|nr:transporter substrate-binding domain-containing protein [Alphaproteobacteria bacterium]